MLIIIDQRPIRNKVKNNLKELGTDNRLPFEARTVGVIFETLRQMYNSKGKVSTRNNIINIHAKIVSEPYGSLSERRNSHCGFKKCCNTVW